MNSDDRRGIKESINQIIVNLNLEDQIKNPWTKVYCLLGLICAVLVQIYVSFDIIPIELVVFSFVLLAASCIPLFLSHPKIMEKSRTKKILKELNIELKIDVNERKKIQINWKLTIDGVLLEKLPKGTHVMGYRNTNGFAHNVGEAKSRGNLVLNAHDSEGIIVDYEIRSGNTGYYSFFVMYIEDEEDFRGSIEENNLPVYCSKMVNAVAQAPEGQMAKLARKIRYQELEEKLKSKSGQGGSIAEITRKEMEESVTRIENFGEFFKKIKETKEKSKEKIKMSNMSDEDRDELLEAVDALADEVIDKKIGMGSMT